MKYTVETIREISWEIGKEYRGKIENVGTAIISTAYALVRIQQSSRHNKALPDQSQDLCAQHHTYQREGIGRGIGRRHILRPAGADQGAQRRR